MIPHPKLFKMPLYLVLILAKFNCLGNLSLLDIFHFVNMIEVFQSRNFSHILKLNLPMKNNAFVSYKKRIRINLLR